MVERSAWNRPTIARALDRIAHTWKRPRRARPRARGDGDLRRPSPAARSGATGAIMGSVSSSGIGDAASTRASGRSIGRVHRFVRRLAAALIVVALLPRSEEHTSELQSLMRISYAVFCLKKKS